MNVKLKKFQVPNFVVEEAQTEHVTGSIGWPLSEIDAPTLSDLCDDFRREVFRKAGRVDPRGTE